MRKKTSDAASILGSEKELNGSLFVLFIPSKDKDGSALTDQSLWAHAASELLAEMFGGSTQMPAAQGRWYNEETKMIITEPVILIHSYARESHAKDEKLLKVLAAFLHRMGRETNQGEIGIVVGDVFHRIRKFTLE